MKIIKVADSRFQENSTWISPVERVVPVTAKIDDQWVPETLKPGTTLTVVRNYNNEIVFQITSGDEFSAGTYCKFPDLMALDALLSLDETATSEEQVDNQSTSIHDGSQEVGLLEDNSGEIANNSLYGVNTPLAQ